MVGQSQLSEPLAGADQEMLQKLHSFSDKTSQNVSAMPALLKRMNDCIARIDKLDEYNVNIHSVFKQKWIPSISLLLTVVTVISQTSFVFSIVYKYFVSIVTLNATLAKYNYYKYAPTTVNCMNVMGHLRNCRLFCSGIFVYMHNCYTSQFSPPTLESKNDICI